MIARYIHKYTFRYLSKIPLFFILIIFEFKLFPCVRMNQSGVIILKIIGHVPYVSFFCVFNSSSLRTKKICTEKLDFCVVHPDMAVYIRIVPILEKLRTVLMPQLPYIGHGSLKKIFSHKGFRFFLENLGQSTKALALYSPQFFQNWDKYLQYLTSTKLFCCGVLLAVYSKVIGNCHLSPLIAFSSALFSPALSHLMVVML